jgi:glycosyltransferase involved in cell wall biosynthesis
LDYVRTLRRVVGSKILIVPTPLFWARMRKGKDAVDIRLAGMRIPGVADWEFSATPLGDAMRELHQRFEAKMRVLYLHPRAWIGEYAMLQELRARGFDVCALEEKRDLEQGARHVASFYRSAGDGIPTVWFDPRRGAERLLTWIPDRIFRGGFQGRNLVHRMWVIRAAVRRFRPDAVVCSDGFSYAVPAAFLKRLGLLRQRLIVNYIGGDILDCSTYGYGMRRTPMVSWLIRNSLRGIDVMRALCASLERALLREGADSSRIAVLPIQLASPISLVNEIYAQREQCSQAIRSRYGIPPAVPLVVTLSGNQRSKGMHDLANAWAGISSAVPGCHWLLCGPDDPWLSQSVWPVLRASGLSERVHFTGFLHGRDVCEHLAAADLHVNPTLCEGLNMATVEAAAVGTPSVTSDGAGIADWVRSFDAGLVVAAGDVPALRDAVVRALAAPELRAQWSVRSRGMATQFAPDRIASDFVKLLKGDGPRP